MCVVCVRLPPEVEVITLLEQVNLVCVKYREMASKGCGMRWGGKKNHPPVPGGTPHHSDVSYELCMCACNYSDTSPELDVNSVRSYLSAPAEPLGSACACPHVCTCRLTNLCRRDTHMRVQDWACPKLCSILCICVSSMHKSSHVSCVFSL